MGKLWLFFRADLPERKKRFPSWAGAKKVAADLNFGEKNSILLRGSTIGLARYGICLFFVVILGMRAENRSGMWEFSFVLTKNLLAFTEKNGSLVCIPPL